MNSGQACRPCRGSCSPIPGRGCFGDLPGDEIIVPRPPQSLNPSTPDDVTAVGPGDFIQDNGKSLCRNGSYAGVLILCWELVQVCRELMSRRDIDLVYNYSLTPGLGAFRFLFKHTERNLTNYSISQHTRSSTTSSTTEPYGSTNILRRGSPNTSPENCFVLMSQTREFVSIVGVCFFLWIVLKTYAGYCTVVFLVSHQILNLNPMTLPQLLHHSLISLCFTKRHYLLSIM